MLQQAQEVGTARPVEWRQADAMSLPFDDASFDAVVCQFGVMFLPDKPRAFAEMRRVLRTGGLLAFNTWDRIEDNEFADVVTETLATLYPDDPPQFMRRTPHGYHDRDVIAQDVSAGFAASPDITTVAFRSRATSARIPALAYCQGTVLRNEIEARDPNGLVRATALCTDAIAARFGRDDVDGKIQAHVITTTKR
jgi:SAM-dependent methyltransferase